MARMQQKPILPLSVQSVLSEVKVPNLQLLAEQGCPQKPLHRRISAGKGSAKAV
jgi:hypothetical protein